MALNRFPVSFSLLVLAFLGTACLVTAVQPGMEQILINKVHIHVLFRQFNHIWNPAIFKTLSYSEFWHVEKVRYIQNPVDLDIFRHDSHNNINILFLL